MEFVAHSAHDQFEEDELANTNTSLGMELDENILFQLSLTPALTAQGNCCHVSGRQRNCSLPLFLILSSTHGN